MSTKVSFGPTSVIGYLTAALAALPTVIQVIEQGSAAVAINGPTKWTAIFSVIAFAITSLGRFAQAHALIKAGKEA